MMGAGGVSAGRTWQGQNDTGHFTPVSTIVSLVYHVRPWEVQPPAALSCGGPSGCLPLKVRLDTPSGPLTFCMIAAQVGARERSPVPAVSLGHPSARGDGEVEADGRLFTFTGLKFCNTEAKTQPGRLFTCSKCTSKWHDAQQHVGRRI